MARKINIVTLGCAKNLVDSEQVMGQLEKHGYRVVHDGGIDDAPVTVINTCGFIRDAKQESIDIILQFIEGKKLGLQKEVFVMGCLSERYRDELAKAIPEVDDFFGARDIRDVLRKLLKKDIIELSGERHLTTPRHFAYLKISEGCSRSCSFCAIPGIRGPHISRSVEEIVHEAAMLVDQGVRELILIAQDSTWYGLDLYRERSLARLIQELAALQDLRWIRIHYAYPEGFPMDLLDVMKTNPKVCPYLDIPFQHISDRILHSMKRGSTAAGIKTLIQTLRSEIPGIALRTSLIVGYPGETEQEFAELMDFVKDTRFERLGVFAYSHEENTSAYKLKDNISEEVKQDRLSRLMALQQDISEQHNHQLTGSTIEVIIDTSDGQHLYGRSRWDSPEIDNEVIMPAIEGISPGDIVQVIVNDAAEFDLFGQIIPA
jgi:ribosomal protein S12 methylthiotransferase